MRVAAAWFVATAIAQLTQQGKAVSLQADNAVNQGFFTYDYSHRGEDWIMGACASRSRQSPIDFPDMTSPATGTLSYMYAALATQYEFYNNGHAYTADVGGLGYGGLTYKDAWYNLMTINIHAESEHTFMSRHFPIELHLVHKRYDSDSLLIVAIPIASMTQPLAYPGMPGLYLQKSSSVENQTAHALRGSQLPMQTGTPGQTTTPLMTTTPLPGVPTTSPGVPGMELFTTTQVPGVYYPPVPGELNFNALLQNFLRIEPPSVHMKVVPPVIPHEPLDLNTLMEGGTFFEYAGSMTAPPCAEIVTWMVRREPILASDTQVRILYQGIYKSTAFHGNYRAVMPLNGREIAVRQAVKEVPPPQAQRKDFPRSTNLHTDREFRAMKWAKDALQISKSAAEYVKNVDQRLQRASLVRAQAYRQNLWTTTPAPAYGTTTMTTAMSDAARAMSQQISAIAKQEVASAVQQINLEARYAAITAASDAMMSVRTPPTGPFQFSAAPMGSTGPYGPSGMPLGSTVPPSATLSPIVGR